MGLRHAWRVLLGLAVVAPLGCQVPLPSGSLLPPVGGDGPAHADAKELPPTETARVCLATADALFAKGQDREAAALYEKARQADPHQKQVCRRLAVLYDRLGDFPAAEAEYRKALALYPRSADVRNDLGYSYYCRGDWAGAEKYLREALALDARHPRAAINLGLALAQQGNTDAALRAFSRAVSPAQAQANLAFVLTAQGKREEARAAYRQALQLDPGLALARDALAKLDGTAPPPVAQKPIRRPIATLARPQQLPEVLPDCDSVVGFTPCTAPARVGLKPPAANLGPPADGGR